MTMNTTWMLALVVIVMLAGFVATLAIGMSRGNQEENAAYFKHTGRKLARLSYLYAFVVLLAIVYFIIALRG